MLNSLHSLNNY